MIRLINFITLLIFSTLLALTPAYAASHSDKEKEAKTTSETAAAVEEGKEKKAEDEEEPDCD